jgi:hypothetical protein
MAGREGNPAAPNRVDATVRCALPLEQEESGFSNRHEIS